MTTVTTCETCGLTYCPDIGSNVRYHDRLHLAAVNARAALQGVGPEDLPLSYHAREAMKCHCPGQDPLQHALMVMWSHYARSLEAPPWNYDTKRHPSFQRYAQAYLSQPSAREQFGDGVTDALIARFGARASACLPDGMSYWRKRQKREGRRL